MRLSRYLFPTLRESPSDADTVSARLMLRAGLIRKVTGGIYEWLPLGLRVLRKVENIVREEMDSVGGLEVWLPVVQPKELWEKSERWKHYGKELLRFKDRKGSEFCLSPTAEEVVTDLIRREVSSWRQLPLFLYQFGTKFRDEIRPRFGVMRAREFYMKDGYSFHADEKDAEEAYKRIFDAYTRVFTRCGLRFKPVEAETGTIGGSFSHEFMVLAQTGEEAIASCPSCGYTANVERAECYAEGAFHHNELKPLQEVHTPDCFTVQDVAKLLKLPEERFIKTLFFQTKEQTVVALVRGDHELNENKLARALGVEFIEKSSEEQYQKASGCPVGYAGPVGLYKRQVRLIADHEVKNIVNGISGADRKDYHSVNINLGRDYKIEEFADLRLASPGARCGRCGKPFEFSRGIEVGHTFKLGTKYSTAMEASFLDQNKASKPMIMGCYGIGVSRVVAAAIEQCHDENGILWPMALAPFQVHLITVETQEAEVQKAAETIYEELQKEEVEVLWDDREERPGVKFKDADLIGTPLRLTLSKKTLAQNSVELKRRGETSMQMIPMPSLKEVLQKNPVPS